jgi:hypothetical protein
MVSVVFCLGGFAAKASPHPRTILRVIAIRIMKVVLSGREIGIFNKNRRLKSVSTESYRLKPVSTGRKSYGLNTFDMTFYLNPEGVFFV